MKTFYHMLFFADSSQFLRIGDLVCFWLGLTKIKILWKFHIFPCVLPLGQATKSDFLTMWKGEYLDLLDVVLAFSFSFLKRHIKS